jgi:hypothetical protein
MRITENDLLPQIFDGMVDRFTHSTKIGVKSLFLTNQQNGDSKF